MHCYVWFREDEGVPWENHCPASHVTEPTDAKAPATGWPCGWFELWPSVHYVTTWIVKNEIGPNRIPVTKAVILPDQGLVSSEKILIPSTIMPTLRPMWRLKQVMILHGRQESQVSEVYPSRVHSFWGVHSAACHGTRPQEWGTLQDGKATLW